MRFIQTLKSLLFCLSIAIFTITVGRASFTSFYAFGDGISTTTGNASGLAAYHEKRFCNGSIWIEVLCKWQGITYLPARNNSYYGHTSAQLVTNTTAFVAPPGVPTALFAVWCVSADFVEFINNNPPPPSGYTSSNIPAWTSFINTSISRHVTAINTLYGKGARTIIMPNAANVGEVPFYTEPGGFLVAPANRTFVRDRTIQFNTALKNAITTLTANNPGLTIHQPDVFTLFESVLANPSGYGLSNNGSDAIADFGLSVNKMVGPATSYLFWDDQHPSAKFQMLLADLSQQLISPAKVTGVTFSGASGQIQVANIPLGRNGIVQTSTNLQPPWTQVATIVEAVNTTKSVPLTGSGARSFYRVSFPVVWTWP